MRFSQALAPILLALVVPTAAAQAPQVGGVTSEVFTSAGTSLGAGGDVIAQGVGSDVTITILDIGDKGTTPDGTIFNANPNPTSPSTGTGVFKPFVRTQARGKGLLQNGYNTDVTPPDTNFDTKGGSPWTRSLQLGEVGIVLVNGVLYYQFALDANEEGSATSLANQIDITDIQIFLNSDPMFATPELAGGYTGTTFDSSDNSLLGQAPVWSLDNAVNGDVTVILQASICDSPGQCGSGHGDMEMLVPATEFGGLPTDFLVFYAEYDRAGSPSGGFEEWRTSELPPPCVGIEATSVSLGAGCGAPAPVLTIDPPVLGTIPSVNITSAFPNAPFTLAASASLTPPTAFGPCTFYLDPATFFIFATGSTDAQGAVTVPFVAPGNQELMGMILSFQATVWALGAPIGGDHFSNGVAVTFGCPPSNP